ncbi:MAG: Maf family protein [Planctomycetota bacterium]
MSGTSLVLASGSPRRRDLLREAGAAFEVVPADGVDESLVTGSAEDVCRILAEQKAGWVFENGAGKPVTVIGSDTVVALGEGDSEEILGKPVDRDHARRMLASLSGVRHRVLSGVAVVTTGEPMRSDVETTYVEFRPLTPDEIEAYLDTGDSMGKAGAYGIQSKGGVLVAGIDGCYYNVVGFPMTRLDRLLPEDHRTGWSCDCASHELQRGSEACGR